MYLPRPQRRDRSLCHREECRQPQQSSQNQPFLSQNPQNLQHLRPRHHPTNPLKNPKPRIQNPLRRQNPPTTDHENPKNHRSQHQSPRHQNPKNPKSRLIDRTPTSHSLRANPTFENIELPSTSEIGRSDAVLRDVKRKLAGFGVGSSWNSTVGIDFNENWGFREREESRSAENCCF